MCGFKEFLTRPLKISLIPALIESQIQIQTPPICGIHNKRHDSSWVKTKKYVLLYGLTQRRMGLLGSSHKQ